MTSSTRPPPIAPYNVFEADLALREALEREGGGWGVDRLRDTGRAGRQPRGARALRPRRAQRADPAHPRPLRAPHRRGGARPLLALAAAPGAWSVRSTRSLARGAAGRARGARRPHVRSGARSSVGRDVPGVDDLLGDARAARERRAGGGVGAAADAPELRRRRAGRHGDDREAGRLRRARQHHPRGAGRRRRPTRSRATSGSAPIRRATSSSTLAQTPTARPLLLPDRGQRPGLPHPAPQGQARHALAALVRGGVPRRARPAGGRGGPRRGTILRMVNHTRLDCLLGSAAWMRWGLARPSTTPVTAGPSGSCWPSSR